MPRRWRGRDLFHGEMSNSDFISKYAQNQSCVINDDLSRVNVSRHWDVSFDEDYFRASTLMVIFLTGLPLNLYIIVILIYKKLYSQPTFLLLINLAFSDLFMCLTVCIYSIITRFAGQASFGHSDYIRCQVCKIGATFILLVYSTSFIIVLLSVDRLVFFTSPLRYSKYVTVTRVIVALVTIWTLSTAMTIPPLLGYGDIFFSLMCSHIFIAPPHISRSMVYIIVSGLVFGIIVLVLVFTNVWIICLALQVMNKRKKLGVLHPATSASTSKNMSASKKMKPRSLDLVIWSRTTARQQFRFFQIFGTLLVVNIVIYIPALIISVMITITSRIPAEFVNFVLICLISQTTFHPLVQILLLPELRRLLLKPCRSKQFVNWKRKSSLGKYWRPCCMCMNKSCNDVWTKELERQLLRRDSIEPTSNYQNSPYNPEISSIV